VGDAIIASHIVVRRVRSLSIALVIALVSSVLSGQQPKQKRQPYVAPLLPAEQAWKVSLPAPPAAAAVMDDHTIYVPLEAISRNGEEGPVTAVVRAMLQNPRSGEPKPGAGEEEQRFVRFLDRCLAHDPAQRPSSARHCLEALEELGSEQSAPP